MIEKTIFSNLIFNEDYTRKVIPFLKDEYFSDQIDKTVFKLIDNHLTQYNALPTKETLQIELNNLDNLSQDMYQKSKEAIDGLAVDSKFKLDWLLDQTEKFCQDKAIYNAIMNSIQILDDKTGKTSKGALPQILSDALAVSFDTHIGHDFLEDSDSRFDFYHQKEVRIPFDMDYFNKITNGGIPKKTLNIALAGCVHPDTKVMIRFRKSSSL
jgi:hypothetical protein